MTSTTSTTNDHRRARAARFSLGLAGLALVAVVASLAIRPFGGVPETAHASPAGLAPRDVVKSTADRALEILADSETTGLTKRDKLEKLFYDVADFETVSKLVMARNWKRFSEDEQKEFLKVFRRHLAVTYGRNIDSFSNVGVEIVGDRAEARGDHTVNTTITRPNEADILVDYRLRNDGKHWRIIDVVIEGVSMVSNFRSQFQDVVSRKSPQALLEMLRERTKETEPASTGEGETS